MPQDEAKKALSQNERMKIFLALVEAQDGGMTVVGSRKAMAGRFGVSEQQVQKIEQEGLDDNWPPL